MKRIDPRFVTSVLAALFLALPARAAKVELSAPAAPIEVGQRIEVQIVGSEFPDGTDGGDFALYWSENLRYVGFALDGPTWDTSSFDDSLALDGYQIESIDVFASTGTPGAGGGAIAVGRLTLEATDEGSGYVEIATNLVGWSLAGESVDYDLGPFVEVEILPLPEPRSPALVLLGSLAVGAFARLRRPASGTSA